MPDEEHLAKIRESLSKAKESLATFLAEIKLAERAGQDMTLQRNQYTEMKAKIARMDTVYGEK